MRQERPAPPVTISGGPGGVAPRDLPEPEPAPERERPVRRRRTPLVLVALAVLAALGVADLRERAAADEAARAEAERRREAVQLVVSTEASGSTSYDAKTDSLTLLALLRVRNAGVRAVQITAVDVPGMQLLAPASIEPGRERELTLRGQRPCRDRLEGLLVLDRLPLEVRNRTGPQSFELALGGSLLDGDALLRACGLSRPGLS